MFREFVFLVICGLLVARASIGYPLHASCKIQWEFPSVTCAQFSANVTKQAKEWETPDNCQGGKNEMCNYKITSQSTSEIKGTHTTPVKAYTDDISFKMVASANGCNVEAFSTSETWYAYLDYGTNYCNLRNLINGCALDKSMGFKETTSDSVCTQFSSANCDKY